MGWQMSLAVRRKVWSKALLTLATLVMVLVVPAGAQAAHLGRVPELDVEANRPAASEIESHYLAWGEARPTRLPDLAPHRRAERREPVKALYITFFALGHEGLRTHAMELIEETELNAIVMDVKGDRGYIPYPSDVPLAAEIGAQDYIMVKDWEPFMAWFEERDVYTIARIVVFKDNPLATAKPEWAVTDARTGDLWRDREGLAWTDPFRDEVWDYNIAIAVEAARRGFDEIQFDYLRFPTDGDIRAARFSEENTEEARRAAIVGFLKRARRALKPYGVKIAVDVFGYTTWRLDDTGIGQQIEEMAPYIDVLSPMLYPSTFHAGIPGYRWTVPYPYETVYLSTKRAVERMEGTGVQVRPWIQDFPDYAYDRRTYTPEEVRAQMRAAMDAGATGWMLWDPRVRYTREALAPAVVGR
jgi:hypothetical protein